MSSKASFVKKAAENIPYPLGQLVARIPFRFRPGIGSVYNQRSNDLTRFSKFTSDQKKEWIFSRVSKLVNYAIKEIPFYQDHYAKYGFSTSSLVDFSDISKIPLVRKNDLLKYDLAERSSRRKGSYIVNTGGSSGRTLSFTITPDSMGHEWAHMHEVWRKVNYKTRHLKLTFGGHYSGDKFAEYDPVRHQYNINIYKDYSSSLDELLSLFRSRKVKFLHGYPSAIYDFAVFCSRPENSLLLDNIQKNLSGVLFGSEYPAPVWRRYIESTFDVKSVSWYGHTERSVLAYEKKEQFSFYPFQTYGFSEAVEQEDGNHLVGTSYYNFASPLIRYDTEDLIEPFCKDDMLDFFKIREGRNGDFVLDKRMNKVALTGLIFGRHHELFDVCQFIQIAQEVPGTVEILYVPLPGKKVDAPASKFNSSGVLLDFSFRELGEPVRTPGGKVKLLVKNIK